jgi:phosphoketolase
VALLDHCAEQAAVTGQQPLTTSELQWINAYWRACNYLCAGMIYLRESALLKEPLRPEHIKIACSGTGAPTLDRISRGRI